MATITYRTTETKAERLKILATQKNISVNKLLDEMTGYALANADAETRFRARAARGSREHGKAMLAELDAYYASLPGDSGAHDAAMTSSVPQSYALHDSAQGEFTHGAPSNVKDRDDQS